MQQIITLIKISLLIIFLIISFIFASGLILIILIIGAAFAWYISWSKKRCGSCGKYINKRSSVCSHCNTIQEISFK